MNNLLPRSKARFGTRRNLQATKNLYFQTEEENLLEKQRMKIGTPWLHLTQDLLIES